MATRAQISTTFRTVRRQLESLSVVYKVTTAATHCAAHARSKMDAAVANPPLQTESKSNVSVLSRFDRQHPDVYVSVELAPTSSTTSARRQGHLFAVDVGCYAPLLRSSALIHARNSVTHRARTSIRG